MSDDPADVPAPWYRGRTFRSALWCGLTAAVAVLLVATWLPWQSDLSGWAVLSGSSQITFWPQRWIVVLIPVVAIGCVVALVWPVRAAYQVLVPATAIGTAFVWLSESHWLSRFEGSDRWIRWGTGATLIGFPVAFVLSVALLRLSARERPAGRATVAPVVAGALAVVLVAGLTVLGSSWYVGGFVAATTAQSTPAPQVTGSPGKALWQNDSKFTDGLTPVALAGNLVALGQGPQADIVVSDAATGVPRWHFSRLDGSPMSVTASADGRTVVAEYRTSADTTVIGLDAATGVPRWQWWAPPGVTNIVPLPDDIVAFDDDDHGTAMAIDPDTGRESWTVHGLWPAADDGDCRTGESTLGLDSGAGVASDADESVLMVPCSGLSRMVVRAVGRSGRVLWSATEPTVSRQINALPPAGTVFAVNASAAVLFNFNDSRLIVLNPATGRVNWTLDSENEQWFGLSGNVMVTGTNVNTKTVGLRLRDATTGRPTAAQPPAGVAADGPTGASTGDFGDTGVTARGGRAYVVANDPTGTPTLTVLDLSTARVAGSYPIGVTGGDPKTDVPDAVEPATGYAVVTLITDIRTNTRSTAHLADVAVRLPGN